MAKIVNNEKLRAKETIFWKISLEEDTQTDW